MGTSSRSLWWWSKNRRDNRLASRAPDGKPLLGAYGGPQAPIPPPRGEGWSKRRVSAYGTSSGLGASASQHPVCLLAGQLGEMVELGVEGADARGGRPELDDQHLDLGLGDIGLHHVPTRPAGARVESEDLPAMGR